MALNGTETNKTTSNNARSVIHCPETSDLIWDFNEVLMHWILLPITLVASLAIIVLNLLVILAIQRNRTLKKTSTILLTSMAIADLLVGAIPMPLTVAADILIIRQVYYLGFCTMYLTTEYSMFYFIWSSLYHLSLIAWERFLAVRKWMDYRAIVTKTRVKALALFAWLLAAFTSFPPLIMLLVGVDYETHEAWHIGEGVVAVIALLVIAYLYIMVSRGVRRSQISDVSQRTAILRAKLESRIAMTTGLITCTLVVSFVPVLAVGALGEIFPVLLTSKAFRLPQTLVQLNSLANPLIYICRDSRLRKAVLKLFGIKTGAIKPVVDSVRFYRRRSAIGSLKNVEAEALRKEKQDTLFKTAASFHLAVVSDSERRRPREISLKRAMSAPALDKISGSDDCSRLEKASSIAASTVVYPKSEKRHHAKASYGELPQDAGQRVCYKRRSQSWDASASVKWCSHTCQMYAGTKTQDCARTAPEKGVLLTL